jgi:hypothetical protein
VRLDAEKLETLRRWGHGLEDDERDEIRSAGRAIILLIEEIERLHIDLWHARADDGALPEAEAEPPPELPAEELHTSLATSLRARLARRRNT